MAMEYIDPTRQVLVSREEYDWLNEKPGGNYVHFVEKRDREAAAKAARDGGDEHVAHTLARPGANPANPPTNAPVVGTVAAPPQPEIMNAASPVVGPRAVPQTQPVDTSRAPENDPSRRHGVAADDPAPQGRR